MQGVLARLSQLFTLAFAVSTMLSLGLGLTVRQVLAPLRNWRFVVAVLVVNFAVVPGVAVLLSEVLGLSEDLRIGLILVASAAGAPMIPKLVQIAKGGAATAIALVGLTIVATVPFVALVLPLLLPGVEIDTGAIGRSLSTQMLLPLAAGLLVRARWNEFAAEYRPIVGIVSNISLVLLFLSSVGQNLGGVLELIGTGGILAILLLVASACLAGYLSGVPARVERRVMALGSGQRNFAAAFIVANGNFGDRPDVLVYVAAAGVILMVILFPLAGEFSRRPPGSHLPPEFRERVVGRGA